MSADSRVPITPGATDLERLLVLTSLACPTEEERLALHDVADRIDDWADFLQLAEVNATAPLAQQRLELEAIFERIPPAIQDRFHHVSDAVAQANDRRLAGSLELLKRFDAAGIACVVLKGMLFASSIYRDSRYKRMNDIDILVRLEQLDEIIDIYRDMGMFSMAELLGRAPQAQVKRSHHLPPFASRDGGLVVGTHWALVTPRAPYSIDHHAIWSRVRPFDFYGVPALAMAAEDNLHHLCVHLPYYKTGVRELADIWNLLRHERGRLDLDLLRTEINKARSENPVYHALSLTTRLVPEAQAAKLLETIKGRVERWYRYDSARKIRNVHALLRSRSTHTSTIEKAYAEFNATQDLGEKLERFVAIWSNLLLPPSDDVLKMSSLRDPTPTAWLCARLAAPIRLSKVFQHDLGRWLYPAALTKTVVDLAGCSIQTLVRRRRGEDLTSFAEAIGLTRHELQAIVDSQE